MTRENKLVIKNLTLTRGLAFALGCWEMVSKPLGRSCLRSVLVYWGPWATLVVWLGGSFGSAGTLVSALVPEGLEAEVCLGSWQSPIMTLDIEVQVRFPGGHTVTHCHTRLHGEMTTRSPHVEFFRTSSHSTSPLSWLLTHAFHCSKP